MAAKYKIAVVGHFADGKDFADGQTVKTHNLYKALANVYGEGSVNRIDTYNFKKNIPLFFVKCVKAVAKNENIIVLPAHNGVKVFLPLFVILNFFFRNKIHYDVIGGWLPEFFKKHKIIRSFAKSLNAIYVETSSMKAELEKQGFNNIVLLPNFKYLKTVSASDLTYNTQKPFKLCIFSRIMEEKGIEDAINVIKEINSENKEELFSLDIYGPVDEGYIERFEKLKSEFPKYIKYKGVVSPNESVDTIKGYFALLFPTRFYTEGVPGTLIDAMAAGVPVISSLWVNHKDVFVEGVTGWGYEFENIAQFKGLLIKLAKNPKEFLKMKATSLQEYEKYKPEVLIKEIVKRMT